MVIIQTGHLPTIQLGFSSLIQMFKRRKFGIKCFFWYFLVNSVLRQITQIMIIGILNFSICRTFCKRLQWLKEIICSALC